MPLTGANSEAEDAHHDSADAEATLAVLMEGNDTRRQATSIVELDTNETTKLTAAPDVDDDEPYNCCRLNLQITGAPTSMTDFDGRRNIPANAGNWGRGRRPGGRRQQGECCVVLIEGLEYSVMKEDLVEAFSSVGEIRSCWVDYDHTDRSVGTGGVIFDSPVAALSARNRFHGKVLDGKRLCLTIQ
eukprot:Lankesteria_metandrocarpae@DN2867_c0_g1_i2.p2